MPDVQECITVRRSSTEDWIRRQRRGVCGGIILTPVIVGTSVAAVIVPSWGQSECTSGSQGMGELDTVEKVQHRTSVSYLPCGHELDLGLSTESCGEAVVCQGPNGEQIGSESRDIVEEETEEVACASSGESGSIGTADGARSMIR
jgi:hypothetical protein